MLVSLAWIFDGMAISLSRVASGGYPQPLRAGIEPIQPVCPATNENHFFEPALQRFDESHDQFEFDGKIAGMVLP
jgi:hypothetical protein